VQRPGHRGHLGTDVHTGLSGTPLGVGTHIMAQAVWFPGWPLEEIMPAFHYDVGTQLLS
jgi:hypothetical protein